TGDITVAKDTNGTRVDFTGTDGARKLAGVAEGGLSARSTEAVNGSPLFATNERVTKNEGDIVTIGDRVTSTETNITNLDGRVTTNEGDILNIRNELGNGSIGLVKQDEATGDITVAKDTNGTRVDFTGTAGARKLAGGAAGEVLATSTEAVNGSQLFATNERVTKNEGDIVTIGDRVTSTETNITNLDGRVTTNEGDILNIRNELGNGSIGLVKQDEATGDITVAKDTNGTRVDFTGTAGARKLAGGAAGEVLATSTEAVNGSQLFATNERVTKNEGDIVTIGDRVTSTETNITNLDGRVTTNEGDILNIRNELGNGSIGLVKQDEATGDITVAKDTNGTRVDFTGTAGARKLAGGAAGEVLATSTEAVNGSQLFATNERVTKNEGDIVTIGDRVTSTETNITNLDGRVTTNEGDILNIRNELGNGSIGLVKQDEATGDITVAKDTNGTRVDFTGTAGARKLAGGAAGEVLATSTEAVNGSQLFATNERVTKNEGDIVTIGDRVTSTETNITNLDGRVTTNEGDILNIRNELGNGSIGLVKQDEATGDITVAKDTNGTRVDFTGTAGARKLAGGAAGEVLATSTEAVNGSQLFATNERVTKNEGDIVTIGDRVTSTETNITNLDGRVTTNEGDILNIRNELGNGSIGLVKQDEATGDITVAKDTNGTRVDFTGTEGARKLAGVAEGELSATSTEAVNGSQLVAANEGVTKNEGDIVTIGDRVTSTETNITNLDGRVTTNEGDILNIRNELGNGSIGLVKQDEATGDITVAKDTNGTRVDFTGTAGARKLAGGAAGEVLATSTEAVNGSQLFATNERVTKNEGDIVTIGDRVTSTETNITNLDGRVTTNEGDILNIRNELGNGSIGLVKQDEATGDITVAKDTNGTRVDFTGTDGARKLAGVAEGELSATSTEAVNGSQLFATNERVTKNEGEINNLEGRESSNEGDIIAIGDRVTSTETNITNLDGRVTTNEADIVDIRNQLARVSIGLVKQDEATGDI